MGVSLVVGAGRIILGGDKGESSSGVGRRGGAKRGGEIGTVRDYMPGMRAGSTKYQLNTIEGQSLVTL